MFKKNAIGEIITHTLCSITFFRKSCCLRGNVEKYSRTIQATDGNIRVIQRMQFAYCIIDATDVHSGHIIRTAFPWQ